MKRAICKVKYKNLVYLFYKNLVKRSTLLFSILTALLISIFTILSLFTGRQDALKPDIAIHQNKKEKKITWYTSLPQRHAARIGNAFSIKHGIDIQIVRAATFLIRRRLLNEIERGGSMADVLTIADIGTFEALQNQGHLLYYNSQHYKSYPAQFKLDGYWAVFALFGICMAYDETKLRNPPTRWSDLLDERWKGRIGLEDISEAGSQYGQYYLLREKLGKTFWKALLQRQKPRIYKKTIDLANAVLKGEIDVAAEFSIHTVYSYRQKKGTSLQGVYPKEGIPVIANPVAILSGTKRPDEAKRFFDFLLSQEGQTLMQNLNYKYSIRNGLESLSGIPSLKELNLLLPTDTIDYIQKRDAYISEFNQFLSNPAK